MMVRPLRFAAVLLATSVGLAAAEARAEPPNQRATPVYVLTLSTDDLDDQADALTVALRTRVRDAQGWSLLESPQSFDTLALALKCPSKPDAACLQRVADQIHADHYVWGRVTHKKGATEITAELHMWSRAKGDAEVLTTFSDNVKDANDASLKKIASRAFGKLAGVEASGTLVVHAGTAGGSVLVDGSIVGTLQGGAGRFEIAEGGHKVDVRIAGFNAQPQDATIAAGAEQDVTFTLLPEQQPGVGQVETPTTQSSPSSSFPVRKVLGYTGLVLGAGLLVGAGVGTALWINDNTKSSDDRQHVPASDTNVCANASGSWASYAEDACKVSKDATTVSTAAWIMGAGGAVLAGTGFILVVTDHSSGPESTHNSLSRPTFDVLPSIGTRSGFVRVRVTF